MKRINEAEKKLSAWLGAWSGPVSTREILSQCFKIPDEDQKHGQHITAGILMKRIGWYVKFTKQGRVYIRELF